MALADVSFLGLRSLSMCTEGTIQIPDNNIESVEQIARYAIICDGVEGKSHSVPKVTGLLPPIDLAAVARPLLSTNPPDFGAAGYRPAPEMKKTIKIKAWEKHITKDASGKCIQTDNLLEDESPEVTFINSAYQYWGAPFGVNTILTTRPSCIPMCKNGHDWLYSCGSTSVQINENYSDGSVVDFGIRVMPGEIGYIGIGPNNLYGPNNLPTGLCSYDVTINDDSTQNGRVIRYQIKECCDEESVNIAFQEHAGGYSSICFCKVVSRNYPIEQSEVCDYNSCDHAQTKNSRQKKGQRILSKSGDRFLGLTIRVPFTKEWERWGQNFKSSRSYLLVDQDEQGNDISVKFIVDSYEFVKIDNINADINVIGRVPNPYVLPNNAF